MPNANSLLYAAQDFVTCDGRTYVPIDEREMPPMTEEERVETIAALLVGAIVESSSPVSSHPWHVPQPDDGLVGCFTTAHQAYCRLRVLREVGRLPWASDASISDGFVG